MLFQGFPHPYGNPQNNSYLFRIKFTGLRFPFTSHSHKNVTMKKIYILLLALMLSITIIGCDRDECPVCHECECVCPS